MLHMAEVAEGLLDCNLESVHYNVPCLLPHNSHKPSHELCNFVPKDKDIIYIVKDMELIY